MRLIEGRNDRHLWMQARVRIPGQVFPKRCKERLSGELAERFRAYETFRAVRTLLFPAAPPPAPGGAGSCTLGFGSPPRILAFTPSVFSRHTQLPLDKILAEKWRLSHSFVEDLGAPLQGQDPGQRSSPSPARKALRPCAVHATKPEPTKVQTAGHSLTTSKSVR